MNYEIKWLAASNLSLAASCQAASFRMFSFLNPNRNPAERIQFGSEEIPCPAKKPRRQGGDSC